MRFRAGKERLTSVFDAAITHSKLGRIVWPANAFREVIRRERARTDRTGIGFATVVFSAAGTNGEVKPRTWEILKVLKDRIRMTDEIGSDADGRLVALLPATARSGAVKVARDVCQALEKKQGLSWYEIMIYPDSRTDYADASDHIDGQARTHPTNGHGKAVDASWISAHDNVPNLKGAKEPGLTIMTPRGNFWKRVLDLVGSCASLILLAPVFLTLAVAIKVVSPGPIFFKQERLGLGGKPFTLWKFRTMSTTAATDVHRSHVHSLIQEQRPMTKLDSSQDDRVIPLGNFMRQTCLDELPQVVNVLFGDMSLVGPRPCLPYEARAFKTWHRQRFAAVPGMTGLWQVGGKNKTTFNEMVRLDISYARKRSLGLDLKILSKTIPAIYKLVIETKAQNHG